MPPDHEPAEHTEALTSRHVERNICNMPHSGGSQTRVAVDCTVTGVSTFLAIAVLPVILIRDASSAVTLQVAAMAAAAAADRFQVVYRRIRTG